MISLTRFREALQHLLHLEDTPRRIALAFAIGVFIGFSPPTGLHIVVAILVAWVMGLNKAIMVFGSLVNNPWTMVPIYATCLWVGVHLYGIHRFTPIDWNAVMPGTLIHQFEAAGAEGQGLFSALASTGLHFIDQFRTYFIPFLIGTVVVGLVASVVSYFILISIVTEYRKIRKRTHSSDPRS
jgi:uncharacterized protein (DUF2062 family)